MNNFFGILPSNKVSIEKRYISRNGKIVTIQAGDRVWAIIFADESSITIETNSVAEENFKIALDTATDINGVLVEILDEGVLDL